MDCSEKMLVSGALFIVVFWLLVILHPFNAIIITVISMILLLTSWVLPGLSSESVDDCDLIYWVLGGAYGLAIIMPLLFYFAG